MDSPKGAIRQLFVFGVEFRPPYARKCFKIALRKTTKTLSAKVFAIPLTYRPLLIVFQLEATPGST
jgi:hypothetical protein